MRLVYDIGPQPPEFPERPAVLELPNPPPGREGDPRIEPELRRWEARKLEHARVFANYKAERARWELESGGGAIEIATNSASGGEMLERGQGRYVAALPAGVKLGPRSGTNRVHHSYQAG